MLSDAWLESVLSLILAYPTESALILAVATLCLLALFHKKPEFYLRYAAVAAIIFNVLDSITTGLAMDCGYPELTPIAAKGLEMAGIYFHIFKILVIPLLFVALFKARFVIRRWLNQTPECSMQLASLFLWTLLWMAFWFLILSLGNSVNVIICLP